MTRLSAMKKFTAVAITAGLVILSNPAFATGGKISSNNAAVSINPGNGENATITLDAPMVCPQGTLVCQVTIDFSNAFPAGITVNPSSITWDASQWSEPRTLNLAVDLGSTLTLGSSFTSTATATSASEYYNGYLMDEVITIPDPNAPTPTPSPTTTPPVQPGDNERDLTLSHTGVDVMPEVYLGVGLVLVGALASVLARKRK